MTDAHNTQTLVASMNQYTLARLSREDYDRWWIGFVRQNVVVDGNGCWIWQGTVDKRGYGRKSYRFKSSGRGVLVHRYLYQLLHGIELRRDQFLCHTCDVPRCCNPDHLWIGTNGENQRDAALKGRHQETKKTHCPKGHPYNEENTRWSKNANGRPGVYRSCRICAKERNRIVSRTRYHRDVERSRARQRASRAAKRAQVSV